MAIKVLTTVAEQSEGSRAAVWEWLDANHIPGLRCGVPVLIDDESRVIIWHQLATPAPAKGGMDSEVGRRLWPSVPPHRLQSYGLKLPDEDLSKASEWDQRCSSQLGVMRATPLVTDPPAALVKEAI